MKTIIAYTMIVVFSPVILWNLFKYGKYYAFVYCANTEEEAIKLSFEDHGEWAKDIKCTYIGISDESIPIGEICESFNAG